MDWNLKAPSWDFSALDHEGFNHISNSPDGNRRFGDQGTSTGDFSVNLKLGQVGNLGDELVKNWKYPGVFKTASSPSGLPKRARGANNWNQSVTCLVDGCNSDLSNCRDYHRRHKVCELHSKTPQVTIGGHKQRFCQQCSRFHSLEEFDEGKRSCRKRLDGHNRRRRKPQPDPLSRTGRVLSHYQGSQLLQFSNSHAYPSTSLVNPAWSGVANAEADTRLYNQQQQVNFFDKQKLLLGSSPSISSYKGGGQQLSFVPVGGPTLNNQTPRGSIALSESEGERTKMLYEVEDCALSLLSSPQAQSHGIGLRLIEQRNSVSLIQPLGVSSVHCSGLEPMESVLVSSVRNGIVNCSGMLHMGSDDGANEASQSLPFRWE